MVHFFTLLDIEPRFLGCTDRRVITVCALLVEIQVFGNEVTLIQYTKMNVDCEVWAG